MQADGAISAQDVDTGPKPDRTIPDHVPAHLVRDFNSYGFSRPNEEVHRTLYDLTHDPDMPETFWSPYNGGHWVVTRAATVEVVAGDAARFSNRYIGVPKALNPVRLFRPLQLDPPHHTPYRTLISRALSPRAIGVISEDVRALTIRLIEGFRAKGGCEFISEFAEHMPIGIFMSIVGLPETERPNLLRIARRIARPGYPEERMEGYADLDGYIVDLIAARRDKGPDDFVSQLCHAQIDGRPMDHEELVGLLSLIMIAGLDTVSGMLGHVARFLAMNPDRRQELRDNPEIHNTAVEEFLRRLGHVQVSREVREDLELGGVAMKQGDMVVAPLVLHNLDAAKFPDPLAFDFRRPRSPVHLSFGGPAHQCLGAMLARTELRIFLEEFLGRIPDFEIVPGTELTASTRVTWIMNRLPLQWSVA